MSGPRLLLAVAVVTSVLVYGIGSGATKSIWILPDELTYGLLARSLATSGSFAIRGVHTLAYPVGYPALIAPAFIARSPVFAYDAAKWINAVLMSLAALPLYLLARRILSPWLALVAAVLTLVIPSMVYTRVLMTENAFYPLTLLAMLAFVRALEVPTARRQLVALGSIVPATIVRSEGLVLGAVWLISIALFAVANTPRVERPRWRAVGSEFRRFWMTGTVLPLVLVIVIVGEAATGRSPTAILGRYANAIRGYPIGLTLKWFVYQLVDLQLYLGVVAFVPAGIVAVSLLWRRHAETSGRAFAAVSLPAAVMFVLAAAASSEGNQGGPRYDYPSLPAGLHDRYCFYVAPLFIVLFLYWYGHREEFRSRLLLPLLLCGGALPLVLPYASVHTNADFDSLALLPWSNGLIAGRNVHYAMAVVALGLGLLLLPRRRSIGLLQVSVLGLSLLLTNVVAGGEIASASTNVGTSRGGARDWIDRAVPAGSRVAVVWLPERRWSSVRLITREQALWRAEFFNPSITQFFDLGAPMYYGLPEHRAALANGRLVSTQGRSLPYQYALVASRVAIRGRIVAGDRKGGLVLYRLGR